jgi:hypothetical protein
MICSLIEPIMGILDALRVDLGTPQVDGQICGFGPGLCG